MRAIVATFLSLIALAAFSLPIVAQDDGEVVRVYVGPEVIECEGVAPQTCLLVSTEPNGDPQLFYDQIVGFQHVPGTSYVLDVVVEPVEDPPADASSLRYTLVEVVEVVRPEGGTGPSFTAVPDKAFCRMLTSEVDGCVAQLQSSAMLGVVPESYAELLSTAE